LATKAIADSSSASCVLHLDHAEREDLVAEAVALGFRSVMFDGSKLDDDSNRRATRSVVERCHEAGVGVEAELGEIGGKDGVHARGAGPILIMPCGSSLTPGSTPSRWPSVPPTP
jgi:fructose-bisphosphate aldolase class II